MRAKDLGEISLFVEDRNEDGYQAAVHSWVKPF